MGIFNLNHLSLIILSYSMLAEQSSNLLILHFIAGLGIVFAQPRELLATTVRNVTRRTIILEIR